MSDQDQYKTAIFAAGCFWCIEKEMEGVRGVHNAVSGYTGGKTANPTYQDICTGTTGHREAIKVIYDPDVVTYQELLDVFWRNIDPLNAKGQFCDIGSQYTTAVYYADDAERNIAEKSKRDKEEFLGRKIVTDIIPAETFYDAEDYHQTFYQKNPERYESYSMHSGREQRLKDVWE